MNEPPGARARVALTGLTIAEYFRDEEGQDVLLFIDNIFRFTQAGSEVSALLGRIPSAVGYQPTLSTDMGQMQERITTTKKGSITSVQAVYVPADDLTDPAPATTFAHLDATTVLSRGIAELGIYPAVDPLDSKSRMLDPRVVGERHYNIATKTQQILQSYKSLQDIIAIRESCNITYIVQRADNPSGYGRVVRGGQAYCRASTKDSTIHVATFRRRSSLYRYRGSIGPIEGGESISSRTRLSKLTIQTITAFEEILEGKHDHISENSFYMVGGIEDVKAKHEKSLKETGN